MYDAQTTEYDKLVAGDYPVAQTVVTIAGAATLVAGTVLVEGNTAGTYAKLSGSTAGAVGKLAILLEDVDVADGSSVKALAALTGEFNKDALVFGDGSTLAINKTNMIAQGIFAKAVV